MAETRRSDFTGERYGDWYVQERAVADQGKRRWLVVNTVTDERRIVLQTELKSLGTESVTSQAATGGDDPFAASGQDFGVEHQDDAPLTVGAGQCKHGVFLNDCVDCSALMGKPLSAQITAKVLEANAFFREEAQAAEELADAYAVQSAGFTDEAPDEMLTAIRGVVESLSRTMDAVDQILKLAIQAQR